MDMTRLTRQSHRTDRPGLKLLDRFDLMGARCHEMCGPARRRLALWLARSTAGPILWIRPAWHADTLCADGVMGEIDPGRLLMVEVVRPADMLWAMEEGLRSGEVRLILGDLPEPPTLTPIRRLHLAAEAGAERGGITPLGVVLCPGDGGAAGVESRWRLDPAHGTAPNAAAWRLARLRDRTAPPATWEVRRGAQGAPHLHTTADPVPA